MSLAGRQKWSLPKIMGAFFGSPYSKEYSILASLLGAPFLRKPCKFGGSLQKIVYEPYIPKQLTATGSSLVLFCFPSGQMGKHDYMTWVRWTPPPVIVVEQEYV